MKSMAWLFIYMSLFVMSAALAENIDDDWQLERKLVAGLQEKDYVINHMGDDAPLSSLGVDISVYAKDALPKSLWEWPIINPGQFLDFDKWKGDQDFKDKNPNWRNNWREIRERETIGRIMSCVGNCRHYRGTGYSLAQYKSLLLEGDELSLENNSYAWVMLFDGTLVRLSPQTSVTFKEFNWGEKTHFYYVRLNGGHMLWLPRSRKNIQSSDQRESDTIFLPLKVENIASKRVQDSEEDFMSIITRKGVEESAYEGLNQNISFNNQGLAAFEHVAMIVMPNGTLLSKGAAVELIAIRAGESWFKWRTQGDTQNKDEKIGEVSFSFRGYNNSDEKMIENDEWHKVDSKGRDITPDGGEVKTLGLFEFASLRIPSILKARELMLERYSFSIYATMIAHDASNGVNYKPYRRWLEGGQVGEKVLPDEIAQRQAFLREYSRREETTGLLSAQKFQEKMQEAGEYIPASKFGPHFFSDAMENFMANGQK